jgi:hypothetical protein
MRRAKIVTLRHGASIKQRTVSPTDVGTCRGTIATSALAQDDFDSGPGPSNDNDDFFSNEPFPAAPTVPERDVLADIRNWLKKANATPMDSKQQKALKKLYDKEVKAMAKTFEKRSANPSNRR